ncbi:MAG: M13 family peptidase, partial [Sphingomicrobium sp.]
MNRLLTLLAASTALAGCATSPMASAPVVEAPVVAMAAPPAAPAPRAELGTYGFDTAGMDTSVLPGDNFYNYANGTWAKNTPIPADKSNYGMFTRLDDISRQRTRAIIEEQAKDPSSKIGIAYNAFLDSAALETQGLAPFQPWLDQIKGISSKKDYAAVAAKGDRIGIGSPIGVYVGQDDKNPDRYIASVFQSGIGLPDRDYYLSADPKLVDIRGKYLGHLTRVLTLAGEANAATRAKAIVDFETRIARAHWTRTDSRDATKTYNLRTRAQFL